MADYPWWALVDGSATLAQGDVLEDCPVLIPVAEMESDTPQAAVQTYDVVVMTQSCELEQNRADLVLVCPLQPLAEAGNQEPSLFRGKGRERLRRGEYPGYHLLNKATTGTISRDYAIVDFRNVYGVPLPFLREFARQRDKRLRLLPPYREHLSQAFARFFMRVGLPAEITFDGS